MAMTENSNSIKKVFVSILLYKYFFISISKILKV